MKISKTYYIESLGCAKNQVDSEILISLLSELDWQRLENPSTVEVIIVNTCGFIESAKQESIDVLISYRDAFPEAKVVATGCLSQRYLNELASSMPELDGICSNKNIAAVSEFIDKLEIDIKKTPRVNVLEPKELTTEQTLKIENSSQKRQCFLSNKGTAYVKIAEGCNNNCSFCAIPLIRGKLKSRQIEDIITEIRELIKKGIKEINLIAQDLGSYGKDINSGKCLLADLLAEADKIQGYFIIRMLYIHPDNFPYEILPICSESSKIVPYFDLPLQQVSEHILTKMNRKGNERIYLDLLDKIRNKIPNSVIRTTFMLGFPGESKADIIRLKSFISFAKIDWAGFFIYSKEEGTPAFEFSVGRKQKSTIKRATKMLPELQSLQTSVTENNLKRFCGTSQMLLVEEAIEKEDLYLCRGWMQAPEVDGLVVLHADEKSLIPGEYVKAKIIGINGIDLEAILF